MTGRGGMELVSPAGTPQMLRAAILAGADAVYCGFRNEANGRNFPGLNFSVNELMEAVGFAHAHGKKVRVAINRSGFGQECANGWRRAVDEAVACGVDAIITSDLAVVEHVAADHQVDLHLAIQAAGAMPEPIGFYARTFGIGRIVLPRVLSIGEITALNRHINIETEAFIFGGFCMRIEGHCHLSSYSNRRSPNHNHFGSLPHLVSYAGDNRDAHLCTDRFAVDGNISCLFEDPANLDARQTLTDLRSAGVTAVRIEGRQRDENHVTNVIGIFRRAFDAIESGVYDLEVGRALASVSQ